MKQPLVWLAVFFCLGIAAANYFEAPFFFLYLPACLFLIFSIVWFRKTVMFVVFILCVAFFLGALCLKNFQTIPKSHIAAVTPYKSKIVILKGVVDNCPEITDKRISFIFRVKGLLEGRTALKVCGKVLIYVFGKEDLSYGEELILRGSLYRPPRFSILGKLSYENYLSQQDIYSLLAVKKSTVIIHTGRNLGNPFKKFVFWLRKRASSIISENLSPPEASILSAMLLGERKGVPRAINESLLRTGTCHILAVSGLHVGIVAFISLLLLRIVRISGKPCYFIAIIVLAGYALLTGARPSTVRAAIMVITLLTGYLIDREVNIYNSLALAGLIILGLNPRQLFNIGFQLSFVCVISIVAISPRIKSLFNVRLFGLFRTRTSLVQGRRFLIGAISVSSAAWLGSLGLVAYYFGIFSPITIIANLLVVSILPLLVASGLALITFAGLSPFLGVIFGLNCEFIVTTLLRISSFLAGIPGAYFKLGPIPLGYVFCYYGLLLLAVCFLPVKDTNPSC
ncbi:MAG: ComEC/Rec2 family competence protein [Candidatus Omnitrophota bacterium]|nr:ComEC/Rec2 family competence protein [Candidatus Omnitrophota bacterium]